MPAGIDTPVGFGRFAQPVRIMLYGDPVLAQKHIATARAIMGDLYNRDVRLGGNQLATVRRTLPDGVVIYVRWDTAMPRIDIYAGVGEEEKDEDSIVVIWPVKHTTTLTQTSADETCYGPVPAGKWYPRYVTQIFPIVTEGIKSFNAVFKGETGLVYGMLYTEELVEELDWVGGALGTRERYLLPPEEFPTGGFQTPRVLNYTLYPSIGSNGCTTTQNVTVHLVGASTPSEDGEVIWTNIYFRDETPTAWGIGEDGELLVTQRYGRAAEWGVYEYTGGASPVGRFMTSNALHPDPYATFTYTYQLDDFPERITYDDCIAYADVLTDANEDALRVLFNPGEVYVRSGFLSVLSGKMRTDTTVISTTEELLSFVDVICVRYVPSR